VVEVEEVKGEEEDEEIIIIPWNLIKDNILGRRIVVTGREVFVVVLLRGIIN
jgi:hypothetical protein